MNIGTALLLRVGCGPSECAPYGLAIALLVLMAIDYTFAFSFRRKWSVKSISTDDGFEIDLTRDR